MIHLAALLALAAASGCLTGSPLERAGVEPTPPEGWRAIPPRTYEVPGEPLAAWAGPEDSSLIIFRTLPVPGAKPEALGAELVGRLENLPGVVDVTSTVVSLPGGLRAARVDAIAPGTGPAWAPVSTGTPKSEPARPFIPTRRVHLIVPRPTDTLWLTWNYPQSAHERLGPQVQQTLAGLKIQMPREESASY